MNKIKKLVLATMFSAAALLPMKSQAFVLAYSNLWVHIHFTGPPYGDVWIYTVNGGVYVANGIWTNIPTPFLFTQGVFELSTGDIDRDPPGWVTKQNLDWFYSIGSQQELLAGHIGPSSFNLDPASNNYLEGTPRADGTIDWTTIHSLSNPVTLDPVYDQVQIDFTQPPGGHTRTFWEQLVEDVKGLFGPSRPTQGPNAMATLAISAMPEIVQDGIHPTVIGINEATGKAQYGRLINGVIVDIATVDLSK